MKVAIRIVDGATGSEKLFAIVDPKHEAKYRLLAKQSLAPFSSDWVVGCAWHLPKKHCICADCIAFDRKYPSFWGNLALDWEL